LEFRLQAVNGPPDTEPRKRGTPNGGNVNAHPWFSYFPSAFIRVHLRLNFNPYQSMKSSYELAMERLAKKSPTVKLTDKQKKELAEIDSKYAAKLAERELLVKDEMKKASEKGDFETLTQLEKQIASDRKNIEAEKEEKKEKLRQATA
jgi:hypothetical protein